MKETTYARLFDIAFKHAIGNGPDQRKEAAQHSANAAVAVLRSGGKRKEVELFKKAVEQRIGVRGAAALAKAIGDLHAPRDRVAWRHGKRPRIAIITGSETEEQAEELYARLTARGASCWFYKSIRIGRRIRREDEQQLTNADYIVFLVSRPALEANWVNWELDVIHWLEMQDRRERLLPVVVDDLRYDELPALLGPLNACKWNELGVDGVLDEISSRIAEDRARSEKGRKA